MKFLIILSLCTMAFAAGYGMGKRKQEEQNPHGFGNGYDETDYEESNPNR